MQISGNIISIETREIYSGIIHISEGKISQIERTGEASAAGPWLMPGFVDAHVHVESSMLIPSEFARMAVVHGTVATVSDPHEIANVLGMEGVRYMIENGKQVPFKFYFGAPSCVPATGFETAGATLTATEVEELLRMPEITYLSEMMNYPGVLYHDPVVMAKIAAAKSLGKPIDGHAPGLRGDDAKRYIAAGISTDHECFTYEEGLEKLQLGMKVIIREGSAAKNFEALVPLLPQFPDRIFFCSDDKHPDDLITGHINALAARALKKGCDLFDVLRVACLNPVQHYGLNVGLLRVGDPADFIELEALETFRVRATYINGQKVAENGRTLIDRVEAPVINQFQTDQKKPEDFQIEAKTGNIRYIEALDGEIVTRSGIAPVKQQGGRAVADADNDLLKITVVNRYRTAPPAVAFIRGFGLRRGAIASCVGHDSHNIIAVGTDDDSLCQAVNAIIEHKGGIAATDGAKLQVLPLPVAGIMTNADGYEVAQQYAAIDSWAKNTLGCRLGAPFMTLSFMALLVIPELKLSDLGLFDGGRFAFAELFEEMK
ncbi:MAG: adenine deaminase [Saprospiraceae bacterium]|nr:adenine deaminase [Saprospiraceae bacterium]